MLVAPVLVRVCGWGLGQVVFGVVLYCVIIVPALTSYYSAPRLLLRLLKALFAIPALVASPHGNSTARYCLPRCYPSDSNHIISSFHLSIHTLSLVLGYYGLSDLEPSFSYPLSSTHS